MNSDLVFFGVAVPVLIMALVQFAKLLGLEDDKKKAVLSVGLGAAIGLGAYLLSVFPEAKPVVESVFWGLIAGLTAGGFYTAQKVLRS